MTNKAILAPQRDSGLIAVRKTGAGTPVLSGLCANFCSIVKNGVGDYTITVSKQRPYMLGTIAVAASHTTNAGLCRVHLAGTSNLQVQVKCFAVDGTTAAEVDFDLIVLGTFAGDYQG